ncbi:MAG TPA: cytochrome c biogenesis protein ResB [Fibrobacteria bacterium]|nr:cytochrome c biogenesis protein ResB [Fibrobacteria bacterium]
MWKAFRKHRFVLFAASFDVTVVCLLLLMVLTFWGTLYQVDYGLYAAQQRMFRSWFFTFLGFIPFPGAKLVLWATFINLVLAGLLKYTYQWRKTGLLLIHYGLLLLVVSAGYTYYFAQESVLSLAEGEAANVSDDYHEWEIALWRQSMKGDTLTRDGEAIPLRSVTPGASVSFPSLPAAFTVEEAFSNCKALMGPPAPGFLENSLGINALDRLDASSDAAEDYPGVILAFSGRQAGKQIVYGGAPAATPIEVDGKPAFIALRRIKHPLPITLQLLDFRKSEHPGTAKARSFESDVVIYRDGVNKKATISMNKPYREAGFTFYQASFGQSGQGEVSTFAVVQNRGRLLPYICCLLVGAGLILHFALMLVQFARKKKLGENHAA